MNNIQFFILLLVASWLGACIFDWWFVVPAGIISGFLTKESKVHIWIPAFISGLLLWVLVALFHIEFNFNNTILSRFSELFGITNVLMIMAVGLTGGLLAGFSGSTGFYLRKVVYKE